MSAPPKSAARFFSRIRGARGAGEGSRWERYLMDVGMRDERVKAQLFRFIDVLPVLGTPGQINAICANI